MVKAALDAWRDQDSTETRAERRDRIERAMRAPSPLEVKRLQTGLPLLATVRLDGAVRRPVRHGLGHHELVLVHRQSQDTSLAVVAPGIAEALFATAIGLVVAIPAVMAYNKLSSDVGRSSRTLRLLHPAARQPPRPRPGRARRAAAAA